MKRFFLSGALLVALIPMACAADTPPSYAPNLAYQKKYVSSDPNAAGWGGGLTDGSWRTEKGATFATGDANQFPKTVTIDLENPASLGSVLAGVPQFGSTKTVVVSLSADGNAFSEVGKYIFSQRKDEKHLFNFNPVNARYVRLTYPDHYEERVGYNPTYVFTTEVGAFASGTTPFVPANGLEPSDAPTPKLGPDGTLNANFAASHEAFLKRIQEGPIGVLFVGDSITNRWRHDNVKDIWKRFEKHNPANFGIEGDKTQHVLWRFENGEFDGISPKVVVLMIGTNNMRDYSAQDIIKGDQKIVADIHRRLPDTKVLLLGIFPRGSKATDSARAKIKTINAELAKLDNGNKTRFLDFGDKLLDAEGNLTPEIAPDALHLTPKGYQIWADAMQPLLDEMMR